MCIQGRAWLSPEASTSGRGFSESWVGAGKRIKEEPCSPLLEREAEAPLLPGLPDEVALLCMARVPRSHHGVLARVAKSWRGAVRGGLVDLARRAAEVWEEWLLVVLRSEEETQLLAYDPTTNRWAPGPKDVPGGDHYWAGNQGARCLVADNMLYVLGGGVVPRDAKNMLPTYFLSNEVAVFDPLSCEWSRAPRMRAVRLGAACCVVNSNIWLAGGSDLSSAEVFDPRVGDWQTVSAAQVPSPALHAATAFGQRFHIMGSWKAAPEEQPESVASTKAAAEVSACGGAPLAGLRGRGAAWEMVDVPLWFDVADMGGPVALVGGVLYTVDQRVAELRAYDPKTQRWRLVDKLHTSLEKTCLKLAALNGELFVVAKGDTSPPQECATHWVPLQHPGLGSACAVLGCSSSQKPAWHVMAVGGSVAPHEGDDRLKLIGAVTVRV